MSEEDVFRVTNIAHRTRTPSAATNLRNCACASRSNYGPLDMRRIIQAPFLRWLRFVLGFVDGCDRCSSRCLDRFVVEHFLFDALFRNIITDRDLLQFDLDLSVEKGLWATQKHNEGILDQAYRSSKEVYLIFGVNKSGEFYGYARYVPEYFPNHSFLANFTKKEAKGLMFIAINIGWQDPYSNRMAIRGLIAGSHGHLGRA